MKCNASQIDKLVLVVHGVGDPAPGDTLGIFARSMADDDHPLDDQQLTIWLPEKSPDSNYVKTFPTHVRHLRSEHESIELAEVFWGDQSKVCQGLLGALMGIFQIVFGLRYVAYVAADQPGVAAIWLKRLGLCSARILHGPVLAVTFFLAMLAIATSLTQLMWPESYKSKLWIDLVLGGCCGFALLISSIGWKLTYSRVFERFWFWVNVTAMFVAGLMFLKTMALTEFSNHAHPGLLWYCRVLVILLGSLWFAEIVVLLGVGACWMVAITHPKAHRPALHLAFLLPALSVGVWGQLLPMLWLAANTGMKKWLRVPQIDMLFQEAIPLLGVQFMMCSILAISSAVIGYRFLSWRQRHGVADFQAGARPPRLIVHGAVQSILALISLCGMGLVILIGFYQARGLPYEQFWFGQMMADSNKYALGVLIPGSFVMLILMPKLLPIFDIVLDVVNHFYFRATELSDALNDEDEFNIHETTFENGTLIFSKRDSIHFRMKRILTYYRDQLDHRPELVIVSHSQGTMIAIEVLNDAELDWLKNRFSKISLVTMGSPFHHLYQHYFSHCYPSLASPFWSNLRKRVDRWVNVFRIDDPVGTEIQFPAAAFTVENLGTNEIDSEASFSMQPSLGNGFSEKIRSSNHPVGCRGHVNYWNDVEVLEILRRELFESCSMNQYNQRAA